MPWGHPIRMCKSREDNLSRKVMMSISLLTQIILKSDFPDKLKRSFFQAATVSILLHGCTTWTNETPGNTNETLGLTKHLEKK